MYYSDHYKHLVITTQLIDMMGTLIERPAIHDNFRHKYPILITKCDEELDMVKKLFNQQLSLRNTPGGPLVHKNMPPVAGILRWSQELKERLELVIGKLRTINHG